MRNRPKCSPIIIIIVILLSFNLVYAEDNHENDEILNYQLIHILENEYISQNVTLDNNAKYTKAQLTIATGDTENPNLKPRDLSIWFNSFDQELYSYSGEGYGRFGHQDQFLDGNQSKTLLYSKKNIKNQI